MYKLLLKLIVYRNIEKDSILFRIADICRAVEENDFDADRMTELTMSEIYRLLELAAEYGFEGNLWHQYLAYLFAMTENPFTLAAEKADESEGSVKSFALNDLEIFRQIFDYDFSYMEQRLGLTCFTDMQNYTAMRSAGTNCDHNAGMRIKELCRTLEDAKAPEEFYAAVLLFYQKYGVGDLGMNKAFRVSRHNPTHCLIPISMVSDAEFDDIIGYDAQKSELMRNTEAFLAGKPANNVLLYGDAGTGKSTSIKALLNRYYDRGLRMIEVYKHQFQDLNSVIAQIKNRNYKFIIYMDDLSFEEFEIEYKYLKAVIEGGLEKKPDNVLIYATSNRRHLIRETFKDKEERNNDLHTNDTVQEKLSLVARFGVTIYFGAPDKKQFQNIVKTLAEKYQVQMPEEELLAEANKWELSHGGLSGRTAQQFINYLLGKQ